MLRVSWDKLELRSVPALTEQAILELGSSAIRLVIGQLDAAGAVAIHQKWSRHVRLGQAVFQQGRVTGGLLEELTQALQELHAELLRWVPPPLLRIYATSAVRSASNQEELVRCVENTMQASVRILSGPEEAQAMIRGLLRRYPSGGVDAIVADLGGGSLELTRLEQRVIREQVSLDQGTLRRPDPEQLRTALDAWQAKPPEGAELLLTGGNAKVLGRILPELASGRPACLDPVLTWSEFQEASTQLAQLSVPERMQRWDLRPHQAEVLTPAIQIFQQLGQSFRPQRVQMLGMALKEALFYFEDPAPGP